MNALRLALAVALLTGCGGSASDVTSDSDTNGETDFSQTIAFDPAKGAVVLSWARQSDVGRFRIHRDLERINRRRR